MIWMLMCAFAMAADALTAEVIMAKIDQNMNFEDRRAQIAMTVKKGRRVKNYTMTSHGRGQTDSAIEILSPSRDKGMKILKKDGNVWVYMPSIERIQKISGHMLRQGMMGSDMSYEDMMSPTALKTNYSAELIGETEYGGVACYKIVFSSIDGGATYHKRVSYIDQNLFIPVFEELYSESGMLLKTWQFEQVADYNGRKFPRKMVVVDKLQSNSKTTIVFDELDFEFAIPTDHFNHRWLSR